MKANIFTAAQMKAMKLSNEETIAMKAMSKERKEEGCVIDAIIFFDHGDYLNEVSKSALTKSLMYLIKQYAKDHDTTQIEISRVEDLVYEAFGAAGVYVKNILKAIAINTKEISVVDCLDLSYINIK